MFGGKHLAGAAKAGDHFVGNQQNAVLVADFPQPGPVVVARHRTSQRAGDRLREHGSDGLRVLELDHLLHGIDAKFRALLSGLAAIFTAVGQWLGDVEHAGHERFVV